MVKHVAEVQFEEIESGLVLYIPNGRLRDKVAKTMLSTFIGDKEDNPIAAEFMLLCSVLNRSDVHIPKERRGRGIEVW